MWLWKSYVCSLSLQLTVFSLIKLFVVDDLRIIFLGLMKVLKIANVNAILMEILRFNDRYWGSGKIFFF